MTQQTQALAALMREIGRLNREVRDQGRASQGAFRSVELSQGSPTYYDPSGVETKIEVDPASGGAVFKPVNPRPPVPPTSPDAISVQGGVNLVWDGTFVGANWTNNVAYVEVHRSHEENFTPVDTTQVHVFNSVYGGEFFTAALPSEGVFYFCLVTVDRTGQRSVPSGYDSAIALQTQVGTDGAPPATSPDAVARGGLGSIFVSWTAIENDDPVTYEVHLSDDPDFEPAAGDPATFVSETPASMLNLRHGPEGSALAYDLVYYVRVIAKDDDGAAAPGGASAASMVQVTGEDIAVDYAYVGDLLANQITGGSMNAEVLLAGLFRTATTGGRVEIGPFGIRVYDPNGVDVNVDLNATLNRFRGSIDAVDAIFRDAVQMFGKNNKLGPGAVLTLTSASSAPAQAPSLSWEYEELPRPFGGAYMTGCFQSADGTFISGTQMFWNDSWYNRNGGEWKVPNVTIADGTSVAQRKLWSHTRVAVAPDDGYGVTFHYKSIAGSADWPKVCVGVWDDAAVESNAAPTLLGEVESVPFRWYNSYYLFRLIDGGPSRNTFGLIIWERDNKRFRWQLYAFNPSTYGLIMSYDSPVWISTASWPADEEITGANHGHGSLVGVVGTGSDTSTMVIHTNKTNRVYNGLAGYVEVPEAEWPITFQQQARTFHTGDVYANTVDRYFTANWAPGSDQHFYWYEKNFAAVAAETWWCSYAWRGEATKIYRTEDSARAQIAYRKGAKLRITVPSLPAPAAGVGQPRDPNTDPYGWVYYLGHGSSEPADSGMYLQPTQPSMAPGVVLADTTITLAVYPTLSGTNPNVSSTFPASTPAKIQSDNGVYYFDGNGDFNLRDGDFRDIGVRQMFLQHYASAATPGSGEINVYAKSDNRVYRKDSTGTEQFIGEPLPITTYSLPTYSGITTFGNTTGEAVYQLLGSKTLLLQIRLNFGSTYVGNGAQLIFGLPPGLLGRIALGGQHLSVRYYTAGVSQFLGFGVVSSGYGADRIGLIAHGGSIIAGSAFASGSNLDINGIVLLQ